MVNFALLREERYRLSPRMLPPTGVDTLDGRSVRNGANSRLHHFATIVVFGDHLIRLELVIGRNASGSPLLRTGLHTVITQYKGVALRLIWAFAVAHGRTSRHNPCLIAPRRRARVDADHNPIQIWRFIHPLRIDQTALPKRTFDILQVFGIELLPPKLCTLIRLDDILTISRRKIHQIVIGDAARHMRGRSRFQFFQQRKRAWRGRDHTAYIALAERKHQLIPCLLEVAPFCNLIAPSKIVIWATQAIRIFGAVDLSLCAARERHFPDRAIPLQFRMERLYARLPLNTHIAPLAEALSYDSNSWAALTRVPGRFCTSLCFPPPSPSLNIPDQPVPIGPELRVAGGQPPII